MGKYLVLTIGLCIGLWACGGTGPEESSISKGPLIPMPAKTGPQTPSSLSSTESPLPGPVPMDPPYDPTGIPDPFQPPKEDLGQAGRMPLEQFEVSDYELVAIVFGSGTQKAMVQDLTGKGFLVTVGTRIGKRGGKIISIGQKEIIVKEPFTDLLGRKKIRRVSLKIPSSLNP